jgi:CheY-like chemotaxis protein
MDTPDDPTLRPDHRWHDQRVSRPVLVVDDDPAFLKLAVRILVDLGANVVTASDAADALEVVQDSRPTAVLVDIGLPDRNGIDLAYELLELPWGPRVVLTSSDSEAFIAIEARPGRRRPPFIAKEELESDTLRRVLMGA